MKHGFEGTRNRNKEPESINLIRTKDASGKEIWISESMQQRSTGENTFPDPEEVKLADSPLSATEALRNFNMRVVQNGEAELRVFDELLGRIRSKDERSEFVRNIEENFLLTPEREQREAEKEGIRLTDERVKLEPEQEAEAPELNVESASDEEEKYVVPDRGADGVIEAVVPQPTLLGRTLESIVSYLGEPSAHIAEVPYWRLADNSAIILDKTHRMDVIPAPLQIQFGGQHTLHTGPLAGARVKLTNKGLEIVSEQKNAPISLGATEEELASRQIFDRQNEPPGEPAEKMTEEELLKGLEGLVPPEPEIVTPEPSDLPENYGGFQFPQGQRELTFKGKKMYISSDGNMKMRVDAEMKTFADGDIAEFPQWNSVTRRSEKVPFKWSKERTRFEEVHPLRATEERSMDWEGRTPYDDVA